MRKSAALITLLWIPFQSAVLAHGLGTHLKLYEKIIEKNLPHSYINLISDGRYRPYFLYGCVFADIQYAASFKSALTDLYAKTREIEMWGIRVFDGLTYQIGVADIPDYQYVFGFDTHHEKYGMKFAEYLLSSCNLPDVPGPDPGGDEAKNRKLAFALGYYAHLAADVAGHDFIIPRITASMNLGDLQLIKTSQTFQPAPNSQMESIIETIIDHHYGSNNLVANTVYWDVWVALDQLEPTIAYMDLTTGYAHLLWGSTWLDVSNIGGSGMNPVLQFFYENALAWYNQNPYGLPTQGAESYREPNAPLSLSGLRELASIFRFVNRFYPADVGMPFNGKQRLDQVLADWVANHLDLSDAAQAAELTLGVVTAGFLGLMAGLEFNVDYLAGLAYPHILSQLTPDLAQDAHTLAGLMLSDMSTADAFVQQHADKINLTEYANLKNSSLFTSPTSLLGPLIDENLDLAATIYDQVGPDGKWYTDWSPWHSQSMAWGVYSSLNNRITDIYVSRPDVGVYDAYFEVGGARVKAPLSYEVFQMNPSAKAAVELYNTTNTSTQTFALRVKKDHSSTSYSNDEIVNSSANFPIQQNPTAYNSTSRIKQELLFPISASDLVNNKGYYYEIVDVSTGKSSFTSSFEQYSARLALPENYSQTYGTYDEGKWPISMGTNETAPSPPLAPTLSSPSNGATGVSRNPTLSWNASSGATTYNLQVSVTQDFSLVILEMTSISSTSYALPTLSPGTPFWWHVSATNSGGTSPWSTAWSFTTMGLPPPPTLSYPPDGATDVPTSTVLRWNASAEAMTYGVQVSTSSSFSTTVVNQTGINQTTYYATGLANGTTYYWRVNAANIAGTSSWSPTWSFTTIPPPPAPPTLDAPLNGATVSTNPTLNWNASSGATSYRVQVSVGSSFVNPAVDETGITQTTYAVSGLQDNRTYYWRVNATNAGGPSSWSLYRYFTTTESPTSPPSPTLSSPSDGATGVPTSPTVLSWNPSSGATSYGLQVSTSSNFSTTTVNQTGITTTSYGFGGLANNTTYYWHVNATGTGGTSAWSSTSSFTTESPPQQYYLTVSSSWGTTTGQGWYDAGSTAYAGLTTNPVPYQTGIQIAFTYWSVDASGSNYAQSNPIIMNGPKTAHANWRTEVELSVSWSSGGHVNGTPSGWYPDNTYVGGWTAVPDNGYYTVGWQYYPPVYLYLPLTLSTSFAPIPLNPPAWLSYSYCGYITLSWGAPSPAPTSYNVYRRKTCGGSWESIGNTSGTSWGDYPTWEGCEWFEYGVSAVYSTGESSMVTTLIQLI
jgi:hypothetical protein